MLENDESVLTLDDVNDYYERSTTKLLICYNMF